MDIDEFIPVFPDETEDSVMARLLTWLNEGIDLDSFAWIDPREGGFARTLLTPAAREMATLYDRISVEFPAAANPLFAWGVYLDQWAAVVGLTRLPATPADGTVTFSGPDGTLIAASTEVGTVPESETSPAPSFTTPADVTITGGTADTLVVATEAGIEGNTPAHSVTAILSDPPDADPPVTVDNAEAISGGTDEETDEDLRARVLAALQATPGGGNVSDYISWVRTVPGVGGVSVVPEGQGPGTVVIVATDADGNPASLATRTAIRDFLDPVAASSTITSTTANTITVPSTTGFLQQGKLHVGTLDRDTVVSYTGITATSFTGVTGLPTIQAGDTVWQTGRGGGRAPIGHTVIVQAATAYNVAFHTVVELQPGYTLGATAGVNVREVIVAAVKGYIDALVGGDEIVLRRAEAIVMDIDGVYDLSGTTINGVAGNVTSPSNGVPVLTTCDLVEA